MKLSILIPVYNESSTILELLKKVEDVKLSGIEKEIIIVDDFSKDGTRDLLKKVKHKVMYHEKNMGKGSAIRTGLKNATGEIILIQDADLEYNPQSYPALLKPIIEERTNVVYGSRFLGEKMKNLKKNSWMRLHYHGNIILTFITNILYNAKLTDVETCYKVMRREVILPLKLNGTRFDLDPEITAKILKKGFKIIEVPIEFNARNFSEGKKINWKDGIKALYCLIKYRLVD